MKVKVSLKISFLLVLILIISSIFGMNKVNSADSKFFGINEYRTLTSPSFGYSLGNPITGGANAAILWNMSEYSSSTSSEPIEINAYCIKGGVGFANSGEKLEYDQSYDMYKDRSVLASNEYGVVSNLVNGDHYNELLALANLLYLPGIDSESDFDLYLSKFGINPDDPRGVLTLDDVKAVQQAAIWYFTNYGEEKYNKLGKQGWLYYADSEEGKYESLSGYNPTGTMPQVSEGATRQAQAENLYDNLINVAIKEAPNFADPNKTYNTKLTMYLSTHSDE